MTLKHLDIDASWTLFLDRDGVINKKIDNDYVRNPSQMILLDGVLDALAYFSTLFGTIVVVTNQQGVGKGLMTSEDVHEIHTELLHKVKKHNGRIDAFYFAPQLKSENSPMRKPNTGMALQAQRDFPHIDFSKSIMVGDSRSDMDFGNTAGMITIGLGPNASTLGGDYQVASLIELAEILKK